MGWQRGWSAPPYPLDAKDKPVLRLNPAVEIEGQRYLLAIQEMAALRVESLGSEGGVA